MFRILVTVAAVGLAGGVQAADGDAERGRYLASIMDCEGCHSGRTPDGALAPDQHLTGGTVGFELPGLGIFWPPNLTPNPEGLGAWTDEQVAAAIRTGMRPDGRMLAPIMPWQTYAALTDDDAADLVAYLRSLPPSQNRVPAPMTAGEAAPLPFYRVIPPAGASAN
jgi:mono/diheme cytochrome c family protein